MKWLKKSKRKKHVDNEQITREVAAPSLTGVRSVWGEMVAPGLTPARLAQLMQAADQGDMRDYLTLAEEMEERDLHYRCELGKRRLAVSGLPVNVEAASDDPTDVKRADAVRELIRRPGFIGLIKDLLDALGKGFSACEIIWDRGDIWYPARYIWRDPRYFVFDRSSGTEIRLLDNSAPTDGIELPPFKFICHYPHLKTGMPIRGGIARVVAWAWLCKSFAIKDWMAFAEVYGMPLRLGKYQNGADKADISILKAAVAGLGSDAAAVIPESMVIDFIETSGGSGGGHALFLQLADWLDTQVSRGILGQSATTSGIPGKLGGDEAQSEVRHDIRDDDAKALAETINRDLVCPFIDLNFADTREYPRIIIGATKQEDLALLADSLAKLVPLGLEVEQSEIRDKFGLSEPGKGAIILGSKSPAPKPDIAENALKQSVNSERDTTISTTEPIVEALLHRTKEEVVDPASELIYQADQLLAICETLEEFQEKLLSLFGASGLQELAEPMAQADMLAELAGRVTAGR